MGSGCVDSTDSDPARAFRASPGGITRAALLISMCPVSGCDPDARRSKQAVLTRNRIVRQFTEHPRRFAQSGIRQYGSHSTEVIAMSNYETAPSQSITNISSAWIVAASLFAMLTII